MNLILSGGGVKREAVVASNYLPEGGTLAKRITKYNRAKLRSLQMLKYLGLSTGIANSEPEIYLFGGSCKKL